MPSAAILAGGRATRFGERDKSALVIGGRSILTRQVELSQIADDLIVVGDGRTKPRTADAVVPRTEGGYDPLCAAYRHACRPVVARRLARERLSVAELFDEVRVRVVPMAEIDAFGRPRLLANVNTPAAFSEISAMQSHEA